MPKKENLNQVILLAGSEFPLDFARDHADEYASFVTSILEKWGCNVVVIPITDSDWLAAIREIDVDLVFNATTGGIGEGGGAAAILEYLRVSYTGCNLLAGALASDKYRAGCLAKAINIRSPLSVLLTSSRKERAASPNLLDQLVGFPPESVPKCPLIVKPNRGAFRIGTTIVRDMSLIGDAVQIASDFDGEVLIQEYIPGVDVHVPVLVGVPLEPVLSVPNDQHRASQRYTFSTSRRSYLVASGLSSTVYKYVRDAAAVIYRAIGCRGLCRCDFRVTDDGKAYFLELNAQHSIRPRSIAVESARCCGLSPEELVEHVLDDRWIPRSPAGGSR